ncbi:MAG TPA: redoxin domain-containing protein, partial [Bacteroidia bacterium]|nr:redoxin domain-containing protein [Bacteroidia bacterium]
FLLLNLMAAFKLAAFTGYKITLKSNLKNHKTYLYYQYGETQYPVDTMATNGGGEGVFVGEQKITGGVFLIYLTPDRALEFLLTDSVPFTIQTDTADILGKTSFTGSRENSAYYDFLRKIKFNEFQEDDLKNKLKNKSYSPDSIALFKNFILLYQKQNRQLKQQTIEKNKGTFLATLLKANLWMDAPQTMSPQQWIKWGKYHFFDEVDFSDERLAYSPVLFNMYREYINTHVSHTGDSLIAACDTILKKAAAGKENFKWSLYFLSSSFERSSVPGQDKVFVHLVDEYYSKYRAWWITKDQLIKLQRRGDVLKNLFVGAVCPDFTATDSAGKNVNFHSKITKLTVLYFWSYDCEHCLEETPRLAVWIKKHPEINLVTACATPDEDRWKQKLKEFKLKGIHVIDPEMKANYVYTYSLVSTPEIFVIDKHKKILAKYLSDTKELDEFLRSMKQE